MEQTNQTNIEKQDESLQTPKVEAKKLTGTSIKNVAIFIISILVIAIVIYMAFGRSNISMTNSSANQTQNQTKSVLFETNMGNITIELASDMPITAGNFEKLVKQGFYDGVIFHRVISGFMIQGGDPTGTGMGDPGYKIKDEFTNHNKNDRGTISMANAGPNTGGSQFFINLVNNNFLDTKHPVFGRVVAGMDVVDKIGAVKTDSDDRPLQEVKIIKAKMV